MMLKQAQNPDIFRLYKRDRREVMGECLLKGEEFEQKKAYKMELAVLKAHYSIFGIEGLDRTQIRMLRQAKVIRNRR